MLSEGELLAGKYRIERPLGEGGMGYVMAAVHEQLQQRVAVKFLAASHAKNPDAAARFLREARATAKIQGEHVGRVLDVAALEDGSPYMVMEFLLGKDLADELSVRGTFELTAAVDYILQACEALAEAHALGLVHRDLKPSNLFLTHRPDGSPLVKVLDFGISKALVPESSGALPTLTSDQMLLGSPAYMSPEQARRPNSVDARTDLWSLGVILYEFLAGQTPFLGDTALSLLAAAFVEAPPSVRVMRPDVPQGIEKVIERCLEKSADRRYQTVVEFAEALAPFADSESLGSVTRIRSIFTRSPSQPPPPRVSNPPRRASVTEVVADTEPGPSPAPSTPPPSSELKVVEAGSEPNAHPTHRKPETLTDWGKSSAEPKRSRRLALLVGGAALLAGVAAVLAFAPDRKGSLEVSEESGRAKGASRESEPTRPDAPVTTTGASLPSLPQPAVPTVEPTANLAPSVTAASATPVASVRQDVPKIPRRRPRDPLDGRR